MKKLFSFIVALLTIVSVYSAVPQKLTYQAVLRNANGSIVSNTLVAIKSSIIKVDGSVVYSERQMPTTNVNGLVSIEIGAGPVLSGDFSTIDWKAGSYTLRTEIDLAGGANYTLTLASPLLSVPYAQYALMAERYTESDPIFVASEAKKITDAGSGSVITTAERTKLSGLTQYTDAMADLRVSAGISGKVDKVTGMGLSSNDFTAAEKTKLAAITGANSGDETAATIRTKLGITTLSGSNTGDQDLSNYVVKDGTKVLSANDYTTAEKQKLAGIAAGATVYTDAMADSRVSAGVSGKVDKVTGMGLSTNDYTTAEKQKLAGVAAGATAYTDAMADLRVVAGIVNKVDKVTGKGLSSNDYTSAEKTKLAGLATVASSGSFNDLTNKPLHAIGDSYGGGIVFWVTDNGLHGLIAAPSDMGGVWQWATNNVTTMAMRSMFYGGKGNTDVIIASNPGALGYNNAAYQASNCSIGGFSDWYLPNVAEFKELVNSGFVSLNPTSYYWTSLEANTGSALYFMGNGNSGIAPKTSTFTVRPIRSF